MSLGNERAAFLRAIREQPQADAPRLIYADWLDEQGTAAAAAQAEFIRTQIILATGTHSDGTPLSPQAKRELEAQEDRLLARYRNEWMRPLREILPGLPNEDVGFARGFPASVTLRHMRDLAHAEELAGTAPLRELRMFPSFGEATAQELAESPNLRYVTHLSLDGERIGPAGARALAESPNLQRLTHLYLYLNDIGDEGARALAQSPHLHHLTLLDLGLNGIGPAGARALAESPNLRNVIYLNLNYDDIGDEGARALAESPHLQRLTRLDLHGSGIGPRLLAAIETRLAARRTGGQGRTR